MVVAVVVLRMMMMVVVVAAGVVIGAGSCAHAGLPLCARADGPAGAPAAQDPLNQLRLPRAHERAARARRDYHIRHGFLGVHEGPWCRASETPCPQGVCVSARTNALDLAFGCWTREKRTTGLRYTPKPEARRLTITAMRPR